MPKGQLVPKFTVCPKCGCNKVSVTDYAIHKEIFIRGSYTRFESDCLGDHPVVTRCTETDCGYEEVQEK